MNDVLFPASLKLQKKKKRKRPLLEGVKVAVFFFPLSSFDAKSIVGEQMSHFKPKCHHLLSGFFSVYFLFFFFLSALNLSPVGKSFLPSAKCKYLPKRVCFPALMLEYINSKQVIDHPM